MEQANKHKHECDGMSPQSQKNAVVTDWDKTVLSSHIEDASLRQFDLRTNRRTGEFALDPQFNKDISDQRECQSTRHLSILTCLSTVMSFSECFV